MRVQRIRYTAVEKMVRERAKRILQDPNTSPAGRGHAMADIAKIEKAATDRLNARRARQKIGGPPKATNFASHADFVAAQTKYRAALDALAVNRVLDDPSASLQQREKAQRRFDAMPHVNTAMNRRAQKDFRPPEERARVNNFLNELEATNG